MKKQIVKLTLKADKIVNLSKTDAQNILGAMPRNSYGRSCSVEGSTPCCGWQNETR